ncbi:MAG: hypothetical protein WBB67_09715 [bacterium]
MIFRKIKRWWRRWRAGYFLKRLRKMLLRLNDKLKNAGFTRHERRRISREILKDIEGAVSTFLKE